MSDMVRFNEFKEFLGNRRPSGFAMRVWNVLCRENPTYNIYGQTPDLPVAIIEDTIGRRGARWPRNLGDGGRKELTQFLKQRKDSQG